MASGPGHAKFPQPAAGAGATKRVVLADGHGDIAGGFDPADLALAALPDSRTFDPFGEPLANSGVEYQIGHQGDWTDPTTGDTNQGARWYNPGSGTFNSRDTVNYKAGTPSNFPNLYAYAGGSPVRYDDPTGNSPMPETKCERKRVWVIDGWVWTVVCKKYAGGGQKSCTETGTCKGGQGHGKGGQKSCQQTNTCSGKGRGGGGGGDGNGTGGVAEANVGIAIGDLACKQGGVCPPPPPKCDAQCQKAKKDEEERRRTENAQKNIEDRLQKKEIRVPGAPGCSGGNPRLCASPDKPSPGGKGRNINPNIDGVIDDIFQDLVDKNGPVVGSISGPGSNSILDHMGMGMGGGMGSHPGNICKCGHPGMNWSGGGLGMTGTGTLPGSVSAGTTVGSIALVGSGVLLAEEIRKKAEADKWFNPDISTPANPPDPDDDSDGLPDDGYVDPDRIRYTQDSRGANFGDGKSVDGLVKGLRDGSVQPANVPPIRIFQKDGQYYSLDNRRLAAFKDAGIPIRYRMASPREIQRELDSKFTTMNDGTSIRVRGQR
ncbi:RHS repeat-associated core domain-containing protein [Kribbella deserti]|uniref:RHS repeat-associated core domain-containing protein n=1 Tax=Kribbella deserti TaxID=1926257 RepID=A0ABV6QUN7_9ACTN